MPRRNRMDPFGELHAVPQYGLLMGNRGCLHDDNGTIVRTHRGKAWVSCTTRWPGIRRELMAPGRYTELFFLDEATALAAGHRPCHDCRREAARAFSTLWNAAHDGTWSAKTRGERLFAELRGPRIAFRQDMLLPNGTMVTAAGNAYLRWQNQWFRWSFDGYKPTEKPGDGAILTAPSIVAVLAAGYRPLIHDSAFAANGLDEAAGTA